MAFKHILQANIMKMMSKQITSPKKNILELVKTNIPNPEKIMVSTRHGEIPVYVYSPAGNKGILPIYMNNHGGGFIMNYALQDDHICKYLAEKVGCVVVSPDYDTAPQKKYPIAVEQCIDVYEWILQNGSQLKGDISKIAIGGQSAGAIISFGISTHAHSKNLQKPLLQIINYPPIDLSSDPKLKHSPLKKPLITADFMEMSNVIYIPNPEQRKEPLASPYFINDVSILPKTLLTTAEYDTLKDEGKQFAEKLKKAGVNTTYHMSAGTDHFYTHNGIPEKAKETFDIMVRELKSVLN